MGQLETKQSQGTRNGGGGNYKQLYGGSTAEETRYLLLAHTAQNPTITIDPKTQKIEQIINETLNNYQQIFNFGQTLESNKDSHYKNENKTYLLTRIIDENNDIRTNNIFDEEQSTDSNKIKEALVKIMNTGVDDWEQNKGAIFQRIGDRINEIKQIKKTFTSIIRVLKSFINKSSYNGIKSDEKINMIDIFNNTSVDLYFKHKNIGYLFFENIIELIIMKNLESFDSTISETIKNVVRPKVSSSFATVIPSVPSIIYNLSSDLNNFSSRREEHLKMLRIITMQDTFLGDGMTPPPSSIEQIIEHEINRINDLIIDYTSYLDITDTILTFLDYQRPNFSEKLNFTRTDRQHRKGILDKLIKRYSFVMFRGRAPVPPNFDITDHVFNCQNEMRNIFGNNRPQGGTLDDQLWRNSSHNLTEVNIINLLDPPNTEYINNAIPNDVRKLLKQLQMTNVICFTSSIDPMGTFGDCAHRDSNDIKEDLGSGKNINVNIYVEGTPGGGPSPLLSNFLKIELNVQPQGNITVSGTVELKIDGNPVIQTIINESNFNKKQPFSIGNTITKLEPLLVNIDKSGQTETFNFINDDDLYKPEDGIKTVFIRKFLGDFLQAIEAIALGKVYLGGDKPAAIMYYYLASLYGGTTRGGFVPVAGSGDPNVYVWSVAGMGGGGLRRSNRRKTNRRTNRKRRTNRRKTNRKRRTNRRKTNKKRRTNRKRRTNNRRRSNSNRRRRTNNRRRRSIRKRK